MFTGPMDTLLHKTPSAPSFGYYWKQAIGSAYEDAYDFIGLTFTFHGVFLNLCYLFLQIYPHLWAQAMAFSVC